MKYFFRELDHKGNLLNGRTFHASGIAQTANYPVVPCPSGKDLVVTFLNPFTMEVYITWRAFHEVELFECTDEEFYCAERFYMKSRYQ